MALSVENRAAGAVDVILKDGGTLRLRPPCTADEDALLSFFEGLSARSLYQRFHGIRQVDPQLAESLLEPDWDETGALAGWLGDRVVGVANYVRLRDPASAEVAFVVADEEQGRGIGTRLLEQLADRAAGSGVTRFVAEVLAENRADAERLHRGRLRRRARARARRGRGQLSDRADGELSGARRGTRPHRRGRFAASVLRAAHRGRDRRLASTGLDRRRALPQRPGGGLRGRCLPGQPRWRARRRCARVRLDRGDSRRGRAGGHLPARPACARSARRRRCARASAPSA